MFAILGILVVFGCVIGGYLWEKGHLILLVQPAELLIIGGAALGTLLIGNPPNVIIGALKGVFSVVKGTPYTREYFTQTLKMLYDLFSHIRKVGVAAIETDVDDPTKSAVFSKHPKFLADHHALQFLCDSLRTYISGSVSHYELDHTMEVDIEVLHSEAQKPVGALSTVADSLPGLGIVAAVLGVVITMSSLGGPPEEVGEKVAAALVGTFLGILLCYGLIGPIAANLTKANEVELSFMNCLREGVIAFVKGAAPLQAVEFARRTIPGHIRPTFQEMEAVCRKAG